MNAQLKRYTTVAALLITGLLFFGCGDPGLVDGSTIRIIGSVEGISFAGDTAPVSQRRLMKIVVEDKDGLPRDNVNILVQLATPRRARDADSDGIADTDASGNPVLRSLMFQALDQGLTVGNVLPDPHWAKTDEFGTYPVYVDLYTGPVIVNGATATGVSYTVALEAFSGTNYGSTDNIEVSF